ncbi:sigma-54 interaction domain-containing protein [Lawsonibacter celer]|uniref:sigma-54 interaction domain-containing protein n=1 Tax=Lawsonibacter celer TaxID=2986526 RepID=UPI001648DC69|nr:sigma 54-interacting transcriptional regulator [Lawsonibacter celer]
MENRLTPEDAMQFVENMYVMAILDREGRYIYVNPGWVEHNVFPIGPGGTLIHVSAEDVIGQRVWDIIPDSKAAYVLEHGVPLIGEPVSGGNTFTTYMPRFDSEGEVNGCYLYTIVSDEVEAAIVSRHLAAVIEEADYFKQELAYERGAKYNLDSLVGSSPAMTKIRNQIRMAARVPSSVLIEGETGTGKELIAHAIHAASIRESGNFVRVNCSAIPPELMEAEFFGYAPGAFTGASKQGKRGRFAFANKGSIFLDEVNLLPSTMQPKFLRVLQEREITPVGGDDTFPVDVRVISASNIPLSKLVEEGKFREDLYFRLNVLNIVAPPLRKRREDLPELVKTLIGRLNRQLGMMVQGVDGRVMEFFQSYDWPGNIRELQNCLERAMSMSSATVLTLPLFDTLTMRAQHRREVRLSLDAGQPSPANLRTAKETAEKRMILEALTANNGNRTKTAKALGISRAVFYRKLDKYGLRLDKRGDETVPSHSSSER